MLLVPPDVFKNGSRIFMRELSAVLGTVAFIKRKDDKQMIYAVYDLPSSTQSLKQRSRRRVIAKFTDHLVKRAAEGSTTG